MVGGWQRLNAKDTEPEKLAYSEEGSCPTMDLCKLMSD